MNDIVALRRRKDEHFAHDPASPLTEEQRASFRGLSYYEPDPAYRVEADLEHDGTLEPEEIQTSDGQTRWLPRAGRLRFALNGAEHALAAYAQGDELFVPFRDATSGNETYGAGRYVEAHPIDGHRYLLDFNTAYNPYCAYNENWSCPLPPRENWLAVPVSAGEKSFH